MTLRAEAILIGVLFLLALVLAPLFAGTNLATLVAAILD